MATHDYIISNASGAAVRADLNNALAAIVTNNSSATAPTTTYAYQWWADIGSSPAVMKLRNAANSAWITLFQLDGEWSLIPFENGTAAAPSIYFKDSGTDTGIYSPGTDQVGISAGGTSRFEVSTTATTSTLPVVHPLGAVGTPSITFTGDLNTGIYSPAADTIAFVEGGAEAARIDTLGRLLVGTSTSPSSGFGQYAKLVVQGQPADATGGGNFSIQKGEAAAGGNITSGEGIGNISWNDNAGNTFGLIGCEADANAGTNDYPGRLVFSTTADGASSPTERARIDSSGRLLVGTTTARSNFFNVSTISGLLQIEGTNNLTRAFSQVHNTADAAGPLYVLAKSRGTATGSNTMVQANDQLGEISFQGSDGTEFVAAASIYCEVDATTGANDIAGRLIFATTADGASSPTERFRIDNLGLWSAQAAAAAQGANANSGVFTFRGAAGSSALQIMRFDSGGYNGAACALSLGANSTNSRSINAGGSINASGADYAEYMIKCDDFEIAKGDICGVDYTGKLTNVFDDAIGFLVKSTNPSYVGGDTWGTEDVLGETPSESEPEALAQWQEALETERQKVDRIAFAGQVPVNVTGATPGQYIVPVATEDGGITGIAKDEVDLTLAEYMRAVGKVIAIEDDGRARIIVKVA
jgi:hypothetical protein